MINVVRTMRAAVAYSLSAVGIIALGAVIGLSVGYTMARFFP